MDSWTLGVLTSNLLISNKIIGLKKWHTTTVQCHGYLNNKFIFEKYKQILLLSVKIEIESETLPLKYSRLTD